MSSESQSERDEFSVSRCPHCGNIEMQFGDATLELSRDEFMRLRDRINEIAMDLPDRCTIHNPGRFDILKN